MAEFATTEKVEAEVKAPAAAENEDDGDDNAPVPEEESTAVFTPVIKLENVEVKTFEEEEDAIYQQRSKLFEYGEALLDKGTGKVSWKEKGTGEVKLLKHKESGKIRLLMRQEKTMKVIANHSVDHRIILTPHGGSDKSYVWAALDFSDYELVERTFAIRFGSPEIATNFKAAFTSAQEVNKKISEGADAKEGAKEADEAASAIESLNVKADPEAPEVEKAEEN